MSESKGRKQRKPFESREYHRRRQHFEKCESNSRNGPNESWGKSNPLNWKNTETPWQNWKSKDDSEAADRKTILTVRADQVGKIIGKQGSKIKEIQNSTGTKISIGKEDYNGIVKVAIIGSAEAQEKCKEIIKKLIKDFWIPNNSQAEKKDSFPSIDWDALKVLAEDYEKVRWADCPPLKKDFYFEDPNVGSMSEEYVKNLRKSLNNITVKYTFEEKEKIPNPVETFQQAFSHYPEIIREIEKQHFNTPFPIQAQAWPILLSGKDMIGIAQTGTGKTLAFLLPALIHTDGQTVPRSKRDGPNVLILAPTRELAQQIDKEVQKYSYRDIKSICVYGGGNRHQQIQGISKGVQIIIATPGRLNDLIQAGVINIRSITFLVLDEADRMLDMGFEPQIRKILLNIRPDKQTVMTSATWPFVVQNLAQKHMINPIQVIIGSLDLAAVHSVKQSVIILKNEEKMAYLMDIIENLTKDDKLIVFVDKKVMADSLASDLILSKIDCQSIHGNREQIDREQAIEDLKSGNVRILIATDVASRGIDIIDLTKVVNYDFPRNIEEYVHRVGRTGRAGKTGEAITFFTKCDWSYAKELISILEEADQEVPNELYGMRDRFQAAKEKKKNEKLNVNSGNGIYGSYSGRGMYSMKNFMW